MNNKVSEDKHCTCDKFPLTPHTHIETDGVSHNVRPDIPTKGDLEAEIDKILGGIRFTLDHAQGVTVEIEGYQEAKQQLLALIENRDSRLRD